MKTIFTVISIIQMFVLVVQEERLKSVGDTVTNEKVVLVCKTAGSSRAVTFTNNEGKTVGTCVSSTYCESGQGYDMTQNETTKETYLQIPHCTHNVEGTWHCFQTNSGFYTLSCLDPPDNVTIYAQTDNTIKCESGCTDTSVRFKLEVRAKGSTEILYSETKKGAARQTTCVKKSEKTYFATFENINDHVTKSTVDIRCYAIGAGITESKNIPNATTTYFMALAAVNTGGRYSLSAGMKLVAVLVAVIVVNIL